MSNTRREPTPHDFKLKLSFTGGSHTPRSVTLFNWKHNGTWCGEIADGPSAEVSRVGGRLVLKLTRGERSVSVDPTTVNVSPFEAVYSVERGWLPGGSCLVYVTYG